MIITTEIPSQIQTKLIIVLKAQKQLYVLTDLNAVLLQDKNALNQMVAIAMFAD